MNVDHNLTLKMHQTHREVFKIPIFDPSSKYLTFHLKKKTSPQKKTSKDPSAKKQVEG